MSQDEESKAPTGRPHPLRFRQVLAYDNDYGEQQELLAVTFDGRVYRREYHECSAMWLWFPLPTVSSTEPQTFACEHKGCEARIEYLPGHEDKAPRFCPAHEYRT